MLKSVYSPSVIQHMHHLEEWSDEKAKILNENAQVCGVAADSHILWPDAFETVTCAKWARVGISGVDFRYSGVDTTMRGRLATKAEAEGILLERDGVPIRIGTHDEHWVINPEHAAKWSEILLDELGEVFSPVCYSALFLDTYGRLPFFLRQNAIEPTQDDAEAWERLMEDVIVKICRSGDIPVYVNGGASVRYRRGIRGVMYEGIPHDPTWMRHFDRIQKNSWRYGGRGVIVGENGGKYRRECLALAMLFDCWFCPATHPAEPLGVPIADADVVGEWCPEEPPPEERSGPLVWEREFWCERKKQSGTCRMKFDPTWRSVEVTLPWDRK